MHVYHYFSSITSWYYSRVSIEKLCDRFYGPVMGFAVTLSVLGKLWVPVEIFCNLHFGLLGCCSGWVFHSDSVLKSDGYLWWWWWWTVTTTTTTTTSFVVSYIYFILSYLESLFFYLSIECNITEICLSLFSRFFETFIFYTIFVSSLYFYFVKNL